MLSRHRSGLVAPARALVLCVICGLVYPALAADTGYDLPKVDRWIEVRTANFTLYSNASAGKSRKIAIQLERFRQSLGRITRGFTLDTRVPTTIFVFRNNAALVPYKLDGKGNEMNFSGYFLPRRFRNYILLDASAGSRPMRVVYHEFFHAVMNASIGDLPVWLNEGLAEYFSTFRDRSGSTTVEVGHTIDEHLSSLSSQNWISWEAVFETTTKSRVYNEKSRQGAFYAQSWIAVHYLMSTDAGIRALGKYMALLRAGKKDEDAFVASFGKSRAEFGKQVNEYSKKGSGYVWWDFGEEHGEVTIEVDDSQPSELYCRLGELLAQRGQQAAAMHHLNAAFEADAETSEVNTAMGIAALGVDEKAEAESYLRGAVEADTVSVEPFVVLAELLIDRFAQKPGAKRSTPEAQALIHEARALLERGVDLHGDEYYALVALARTYLYEGEDLEEGVAAMDLARTLRPLDPAPIQIQALLLSYAGQVEEAWTVLVQDLEPRDPDLAREAVGPMIDGVEFAARKRLAADDRAGAEAILEKAVATIPDSESTTRLEEMYEIVTAGNEVVFNEPSEVERLESQAVDDYNRAANLGNSGNYVEAIRVYERLAEECVHEEICKAARQNAIELREALEHNRNADAFNEALSLANGGDRKGAVTVLRGLEERVEDPELLARVRELLRSLGARVSKGEEKN